MNGIGAYHSGSHTTHVYYPWIRVFDSNSTSKWTNYAINGTFTKYDSNYVKKVSNVPVTNNGKFNYVNGIQFYGMKDKSTYFSIKDLTITLPYADNKIVIAGYDPDIANCGKWTLQSVYGSSSSEIKAELQRIS